MIETIPHRVIQQKQDDGALLLTSAVPIGPVARRVGDWLDHWAQAAATRVFLAERSGAGWREETFGSVFEQVEAVAQSLLSRGMTAHTPIIILSGAGIDHGVLTLAAHSVGIPIVPVAPQYAFVPDAHARLMDAVRMVRPVMAYVDHAAQFRQALALSTLADIEIVASQPEGAGREVTDFRRLLAGDRSVDLTAAKASVGPDTVAKIILTSGSTSSPKGVITTQRMLCANQAQIAAVQPVLGVRPPVILDWLPWNHVFGGSHNFNMMLSNGGSLYIDDGKPTPQDFGRTLENHRLISGTLALNVPVGFSLLVQELRKDRSLRQRFFKDLDLIFYAGASLPGEVWEGLEQMSKEVRGKAPLMVGSWGMTETAPSAIMVHETTQQKGAIGVPLPGVTVKLLPLQDQRFELRVAGPNVMPGYFDDAEKTAHSFDAEGYLKTGDAVKMCDPADPDAGLLFDGRISEDFKLLTGTWVRASALRVAMLDLLVGLVHDVVIVGENRNDIGLLIFPLPHTLKHTTGSDVLDVPPLTASIAQRLAQAARTGSSSMRIARALVMAEPPSVTDGEITPKGSLNTRKILTRRAGLVDRLYAQDDPRVIRP